MRIVLRRCQGSQCTSHRSRAPCGWVVNLGCKRTGNGGPPRYFMSCQCILSGSRPSSTSPHREARQQVRTRSTCQERTQPSTSPKQQHYYCQTTNPPNGILAKLWSRRHLPIHPHPNGMKSSKVRLSTATKCSSAICDCVIGVESVSPVDDGVLCQVAGLGWWTRSRWTCRKRNAFQSPVVHLLTHNTRAYVF